MKAFRVAAILVLAAACGQVHGSPTSSVVSPTPTPVASPTVVASPVPSPSSAASPHPTPKASSSMLFAVLEARGTTNAWTYNTVAIAGLDGYARAKTTFTPMPVPALGCMGAIIPPSAHVAAGKVFFADAKGVIRSLAIDGKVSTVATFPMTSTQQMLSFAVSPDGATVLGTLFTTPKNAYGCDGPITSTTFTFDAYTATAGQPARLVYHESWAKAPASVMALTGWDALGPFGTYPTVWASQGGGPGSTLGVYVRIDASTVKPGALFSDPSKCQVWDSVSSGAFVCIKDAVISGGGTPDQQVVQQVSVRGADGTELWPFTFKATNGAYGSLLAPDGQRVTMCCADVSAGFAYLLVGRTGGQVTIAQGFYGEGWLDSTTMVGEVNTSPTAQPPFKLAYVSTTSPGLAVSLGFTGKYVGTVRI